MVTWIDRLDFRSPPITSVTARTSRSDVARTVFRTSVFGANLSRVRIPNSPNYCEYSATTLKFLYGWECTIFFLPPPPKKTVVQFLKFSFSKGHAEREGEGRKGWLYCVSWMRRFRESPAGNYVLSIATEKHCNWRGDVLRSELGRNCDKCSFLFCTTDAIGLDEIKIKIDRTRGRFIFSRRIRNTM